MMMLRVFACAAVVALASAQLSADEQAALAQAQALIQKLEEERNRVAAADAKGPSVSFFFLLEGVAENLFNVQADVKCIYERYRKGEMANVREHHLAWGSTISLC